MNNSLPSIGSWVRFYGHFGGCLKEYKGRVIGTEAPHIDIQVGKTVYTRYYFDTETLPASESLLLELEF